MRLIVITANPTHAREAELAGVDRVMVDLELIGKDARQGHLNTVISRHTLEDVAAVRGALTSADLLVRVNPIHEGSAAEIDAVIAAGADRIMLPMFRHPDEVAAFLGHVNGRVPHVLLLETSAALARLPQIIALPGVDEVHIGLNDLHLDMSLDFMFELFPSGLIDHAAKILRAAGIPFGIGGVARLGTGMLPADMIVSEHVRVGSTGVILSRDFAQVFGQDGTFATEVARLRSHVAALAEADTDALEETRQQANSAVHAVATAIRARKLADGNGTRP